MIYGIGTDLTRTDRLEKSLRSPAFLKRVYGPGEQQLLNQLKDVHRTESAAADFAAKEAFLKACGKGIGDFALNEIEALRRESGAPYYEFHGKTAEFMQKEKLTASLSLSHEGGLAIAFAVLEKID